MPRTVFMGNLPAWVTADEIEGWLSNEDILFDEVKVIRDFETQESKGYAFVEAAADEDVKALIARFNRAPLDDKVLRVNLARSNDQQRGRPPRRRR
jgi:RNA recognition motif-containing protein